MKRQIVLGLFLGVLRLDSVDAAASLVGDTIFPLYPASTTFTAITAAGQAAALNPLVYTTAAAGTSGYFGGYQCMRQGLMFAFP